MSDSDLAEVMIRFSTTTVGVLVVATSVEGVLMRRAQIDSTLLMRWTLTNPTPSLLGVLFISSVSGFFAAGVVAIASSKEFDVTDVSVVGLLSIALAVYHTNRTTMIAEQALHLVAKQAAVALLVATATLMISVNIWTVSVNHVLLLTAGSVFCASLTQRKSNPADMQSASSVSNSNQQPTRLFFESMTLVVANLLPLLVSNFLLVATMIYSINSTQFATYSAYIFVVSGFWIILGSQIYPIIFANTHLFATQAGQRLLTVWLRSSRSILSGFLIVPVVSAPLAHLLAQIYVDDRNSLEFELVPFVYVNAIVGIQTVISMIRLILVLQNRSNAYVRVWVTGSILGMATILLPVSPGPAIFVPAVTTLIVVVILLLRIMTRPRHLINPAEVS
jgi:hypothetical protein